MELTPGQRDEVLKLQKVIKQCEGILRISKDTSSISRTRDSLKQARERLDYLCPRGVPSDLIYEEKKVAPKLSINEMFSGCVILSSFSVQKASLYCEDKEVNILTTVVRVWDSEFAPVLAGQHVKLDFSTSVERDSHFSVLENIKRQLKSVGDVISNFHFATGESAKMQLQEIKIRYTRNFLISGVAFIKQIKEFWSNVLKDIKQNGIQCLNVNDIIQIDPALEKPTYLNKKTVAKAIETACLFLEEGLELIRPPDFKS